MFVDRPLREAWPQDFRFGKELTVIVPDLCQKLRAAPHLHTRR
jgi:hypothetical protein